MTNPFNARNETFGEMRTKLRARLGFMVQGPAAATNAPVLNSFLQEGQAFIAAQVNQSTSRKMATIRLEPGSYLYDWHNDDQDEDIDPSKVITMWVRVGDNELDRVTQGISPRMREQPDQRSQPCLYDTLNGQIELFPIPDQAYDLVIEYTGGVARLTQDADRPSVPSDLVFLYALANAKAHYRHPDAQVVGQTFQTMLSAYKKDQHENRRYVANTQPDSRYQVVRTADGYRLGSE